MWMTFQRVSRARCPMVSSNAGCRLHALARHHLLAAVILVFLRVERSLHADNALQIRIAQSPLGVLNSVDKFVNAPLVSNSLCLLATIQSVRCQLAHTRHCDTKKSKAVAKPASAFNDADHDADEGNQDTGPSRKQLELSETLIRHITRRGVMPNCGLTGLANCGTAQVQLDQPGEHLLMVQGILPPIRGIDHAVEPLVSLLQPSRSLVVEVGERTLLKVGARNARPLCQHNVRRFMTK